MSERENPEVKFQVVDESGRVLFTAWTPVRRTCRDCGAEYDTTIDVQYICNKCLAQDLADAILHRGRWAWPP